MIYLAPTTKLPAVVSPEPVYAFTPGGALLTGLGEPIKSVNLNPSNTESLLKKVFAHGLWLIRLIGRIKTRLNSSPLIETFSGSLIG